MGKFIHYTSIENSYNEAFLASKLKRYPQLATEKFYIQHKYDGSNFQTIFSKNEPVKYCSRNRNISPTEKFFGYQKVLPGLDKVRQRIQDFLNQSEYESINLFGELYGKNVIQRITYDSESDLNLKFFDVYFDEVRQSPGFFYEWAAKVGIPEDNLVETLTKEPITLDEALKFDTNSVKTKCDDIIEGVVIKSCNPLPLSKKCQDENQGDKDFRLVIKLKSAEYLERELTPNKLKKTPKSVDTLMNPNIEEGMSPIQREFNRYINENRVINSFTKQEWSKKEMKLLVDFVINDGLVDFLKDIDGNKFDEVFTEEELMKFKGFDSKSDLKIVKTKLDLPAKKTQQQTFIIAKKMFN